MLRKIVLAVALSTGIDSGMALERSAGNDTATAFKIAPGSALTIKLVDDAWTKRESLANQKIIADYLSSQPSIPADYETAWKTARLVYFIGNFGYGEKLYVSSAAGVKLFDYGVSAGKIALGLKPDNVEGQYWFAVDLGSYGLARGIIASATHAKSGMEALRQAILLDPGYQWSGSSRILGRYYQELPGVFGGSNKKALEYIQAAITAAPQMRNNWVFLGQYYLSVGEGQAALAACQKALSLSNQDGKYEEIRYIREAKECVDSAKSRLGG